MGILGSDGDRVPDRRAPPTPIGTQDEPLVDLGYPRTYDPASKGLGAWNSGGSVVLTRRRGVVGILVGTMLAFVVLLFRTGAPASAATTWNTGDVFVAVGNG